MKKFRMPTAYTILFVLLILVAAATWLIPAGSYEHGEDGAPAAGTYHQVEQQPQGPGDVVQASFEGFYDAVDVAVFILMVGGFLGVVMRTGAIDAGVSNVIRLLGGREIWLVPALMILFSLGGTSFGMWEETMAFYPLLVPVFVSAGYDALTGVAVVLLGSGVRGPGQHGEPLRHRHCRRVRRGVPGGRPGGCGFSCWWCSTRWPSGTSPRYAVKVRRDPSRSLVADISFRHGGEERKGGEPPGPDGAAEGGAGGVHPNLPGDDLRRHPLRRHGPAHPRPGVVVP